MCAHLYTGKVCIWHVFIACRYISPAELFISQGKLSLHDCNRLVTGLFFLAPDVLTVTYEALYLEALSWKLHCQTGESLCHSCRYLTFRTLLCYAEVLKQNFISQGSFAAVLVTVEQKATVLLLSECQSKTVGRSVAADLSLTGQFCGCSCYCWTESHCVAAFSVKAKPCQQKCWSRLFSHRAVLGLFSLLLKRKPLFCCFQSVKLKAKLCQQGSLTLVLLIVQLETFLLCYSLVLKTKTLWCRVALITILLLVCLTQSLCCAALQWQNKASLLHRTSWQLLLSVCHLKPSCVALKCETEASSFSQRYGSCFCCSVPCSLAWMLHTEVWKWSFIILHGSLTAAFIIFILTPLLASI